MKAAHASTALSYWTRLVLFGTALISKYAVSYRPSSFSDRSQPLAFRLSCKLPQSILEYIPGQDRRAVRISSSEIVRSPHQKIACLFQQTEYGNVPYIMKYAEWHCCYLHSYIGIVYCIHCCWFKLWFISVPASECAVNEYLLPLPLSRLKTPIWSFSNRQGLV